MIVLARIPTRIVVMAEASHEWSWALSRASRTAPPTSETPVVEDYLDHLDVAAERGHVIDPSATSRSLPRSFLPFAVRSARYPLVHAHA